MVDGNLTLWDSVSTTDPDHTKQVNQRGGFTAINAHYQIREATRAFGPVGVGWGYESSTPIFEGGTIIVPVVLWHGDRGNKFGPWYGCAKFPGDRVDEDAPKKAMTDAITKGLSHLGFSADVFLKMYDDSKYVEGLRAEKAQAGLEGEAQQKITAIGTCDSIQELHAFWTGLDRQLQAHGGVIAAKDARKAVLSDETKGEMAA